MTNISHEIQHNRKLEMLQQWSAYHYWHLTNVHHLTKKFKNLSWDTHVIVGFHKLTVHRNGANTTSVFYRNHKVSAMSTEFSFFCVHTLKTKSFRRCWLIKRLLLPLSCLCCKTTQNITPCSDSSPKRTPVLKSWEDFVYRVWKWRFISWRIKICIF